MKILVTGGAGYVGCALTKRLLKESYYVRVLDNLMFGGESLLGIYNEPKFEFIKGDIRDKKIVKIALKGIENVIHLAALVGHPLCCARPNETEEINYKATCLIFDEAVCRKVKRFIFASSCSNYGVTDTEKLAEEDSSLKPLSLYAETKVKAEKYILSSSRKKKFSPCVLRLATVFGLSSRMRFDLLINELVRDALIKKNVSIQNINAWRPFLHTQDAAEIFLHSLKSSPQEISGQVFNVGSGNYQKRQIAEIIKKYIPDISIDIVKDGNDKRDYKVSFDKARRIMDFKPRLTLDQGIVEIKETIEKGIISDPFNPKYTNAGF